MNANLNAKPGRWEKIKQIMQKWNLGKFEAIVLPDDDTLILSKSFHMTVTVIANGENVRRQFSDFLIFIQLDLFSGVDG